MRPLDLHPWDISPKKAIEIQKALSKMVILEGSIKGIRVVGGADVSYSPGGNRCWGAVVLLSFPDLKVIEEVRVEAVVKFPYIPGLLTFREGPPLLEAFKRIENEPDVVIFGGQGIAHPRRMGLATHLGILLNIPSIGCAKTHLWGRFDNDVGKKRGSYTLIKDKEGEILGVLIRTREGVSPLFVSQGHRIDLEGCIDLVLRLCPRYRLPEPLRVAHSLSKG